MNGCGTVAVQRDDHGRTRHHDHREGSPHPACGVARAGAAGTSRASLFQTFQVLKLDQFTVAGLTRLGRRNLDFADLDELIVEGLFHGGWPMEVNFSSVGSSIARITSQRSDRGLKTTVSCNTACGFPTLNCTENGVRSPRVRP